MRMHRPMILNSRPMRRLALLPLLLAGLAGCSTLGIGGDDDDKGTMKIVMSGSASDTLDW